MGARGAFPDVEVLVRAVLLRLDVEGLQIGARVPADDGGSYSWLPFLRVRCLGGAETTNLITDKSQVDVDAFAAPDPVTGKAPVAELAEQVRQLLTAGPAVVAGLGKLDRCVTVSKPKQAPYGDETRVVMYAATYTASARRAS